MTDTTLLLEYIRNMSNRGDCKCGVCLDGVPDPKQPDGHTADLIFFKVSKNDHANAKTFRSLVEDTFPHWLDSKEHGYIELGADIGDQGIAMQAMGLGALLGIWNLLTPRLLGVDDATALNMAGMGLLTICSEKRET